MVRIDGNKCFVAFENSIRRYVMKVDPFWSNFAKIIATIFVFALIILILVASWGFYKKCSIVESPIKQEAVAEVAEPVATPVPKPPKAVLTLYAPREQKKQLCVVVPKKQKPKQVVAVHKKHATSKTVVVIKNSIPTAVVTDDSIPTAVVTKSIITPVAVVTEVNTTPTAAPESSVKQKPGVLDEVDTDYKKAVIVPNGNRKARAVRYVVQNQHPYHENQYQDIEYARRY